jgi:hypothetical protein
VSRRCSFVPSVVKVRADEAVPLTN